MTRIQGVLPTRAVRIPTDSEDPLDRLLDTLVRNTRAGQLQWRFVNDERAVSPRFDLDLPSGNIEISSVDEDGQSPYLLTLFTPGPEYAELESINGRNERARNEALGELYRLASRSARGVTRIVNQLTDEINQMNTAVVADGDDEELPF